MSRRALAVIWAVFAAANVVAMAVWPQWATVPFHFVWVSLTIVYGFAPWGRRATVITLAVVSVVTGATLLGVAGGAVDVDEVTEVPLMGAMFVAMVWHASRRQRAVDELRASGERERVFLRSASHELRTPITVARGHAELLRSEAEGGQAADLDVVLGELRRLGTIADRLVTLAQAEVAPTVAREPVDIAALVADCERRWPAAAPRAWSFDVRGPVVVRADPTAIAAALDALIDNAVKATAAGDAIGVSAAAENGTAVLAVRDGGVGIPAADVRRVFDPFWHADAGGSGQRGGAGLGLSIVAAVAKAHDGSVAAESVRGTGTTMTMRLPVDAGQRP